MSIKRRLALRFTFQLAVGGLAALVVFTLCMNWIAQRFSEKSISADFASVGLEQLVERSQFHADGIRFAPELLEQVNASQGWIQTLGPDGNVLQAYNTPPDVPRHYAPGELVDYWQQRKPFAYDIMLWIKVKDGKEYTIIYGYHNQLLQWLRLAEKEGGLDHNRQLLLSGQLKESLKAAKGFVQLLDAKGAEIASYNKPPGISAHYTPQDLALRNRYNDRYGYLYISSFDAATKQTWVIAIPNTAGGRDGNYTLLPAETQILLAGGAVMIGALIVIFILLSIWNAHRFGKPLLHILVWLNKLSTGHYDEPSDRKGMPRSVNRKGKRRSRYNVFSDVLQSVGQLARSLQRNEELRRQNNRLREEWIAGITHDLKTPLSSITGYAHMLHEEGYQWSPAEVRSFSSIILDKSAHMDLLINDLALTYRINAGIKPAESEPYELNAWLESTLASIADPLQARANIKLHQTAEPIIVSLHMPWLERVVSNLAANALMHNPPGTRLDVYVQAGKPEGRLAITFADNGDGMDDSIASRLFERYYRGTDTGARTEGSGLGMAIAKGLVEAMDGHIKVVTASGQGTTILLVWPAALAVAGS